MLAFAIRHRSCHLRAQAERVPKDTVDDAGNAMGSEYPQVPSVHQFQPGGRSIRPGTGAPGWRASPPSG